MHTRIGVPAITHVRAHTRTECSRHTPAKLIAFSTRLGLEGIAQGCPAAPPPARAVLGTVGIDEAHEEA